MYKDDTVACRPRQRFSRRDFMKLTGSAAALASIGSGVIIPGRARAQQKTLKILQWHHFVPEYDRWFNEVYVKQWGEQNDTRVIVDNVGMTSLDGRAAAEVAGQQGYDLFMFLLPPPVYEDQVIDHREIYEECRHKYGTPLDIALKSTYNPKTNKFFGFSDSYVPDPVNYRKDLWDDVGQVPNSWEDVRNDAQATPRDKYNVFADVSTWTANVGYPGYANAAIDEIFRTWLISTMFAQTAAGKVTPEQALHQADQEVRRIFQKWGSQGKV